MGKEAPLRRGRVGPFQPQAFPGEVEGWLPSHSPALPAVSIWRVANGGVPGRLAAGSPRRTLHPRELGCSLVLLQCLRTVGFQVSCDWYTTSH